MSRRSEPSQRQLRVGELVRHALSDLFARGQSNDPDLERVGVTVLEVSMSPDLKQAKAYVRPFEFGGEADLMDALKRNRKYLRKLLSPQLALKFMPELTFELDTASDHARHIDELLHAPDVRRDLAGDHGHSETD